MYDIVAGQKLANVPESFTQGVNAAQTMRANNTSEKFNQLKIQAHKLDVLKELAGSVKDDAGLARAKGFAQSMGIGDDVLGQLGNTYAEAKPLLDSFYANSDAAKTELANQWKMLEMGMKQQEYQDKRTDRLPTDVYGRPITPQQSSDAQGKTSDDLFGGGDSLVETEAEPQTPNPLNDIILIKGKPFSKTTGKPIGGKEGLGGAIMSAAEKIQAENPKMSFTQAYNIAKQGLGTGNTIEDGVVQPIAGNLDTLKDTEFSKAEGKQSGKQKAIDIRALPNLVATGNQAIATIDAALNSDGFDSNFGMASYAFNRRGSDAADAKAFIDQIAGQNFLTAYETLKGGGAITEVEGAKAEQAKARLTNSQSAEEARAALQELKGYVQKGIERATMQAQGKSLDEILKGENQSSTPTIQASIINKKTGEKLILKDGAWVKP